MPRVVVVSLTVGPATVNGIVVDESQTFDIQNTRGCFFFFIDIVIKTKMIIIIVLRERYKSDDNNYKPTILL